jgi:hypothetical protein
MPILTHAVPTYRRHKSTGQAVVTLDGRDFYVGKYKSKKSRDEYDRLVGQWQANGRRLPAALRPTGGEISVVELIDAYWQHAKQYYVKDGRPTSEQYCFRSATRPPERSLRKKTQPRPKR